MRSCGISWNSHMWHFQFSIWLKCSLGEVHFAEKPHLNRSTGSKVVSNWRVLRTIENNRNSFLFLGISHNQCYRLPTDTARSQHIWIIWKAIHLYNTICRSLHAMDYINSLQGRIRWESKNPFSQRFSWTKFQESFLLHLRGWTSRVYPTVVNHFTWGIPDMTRTGSDSQG